MRARWSEFRRARSAKPNAINVDNPTEAAIRAAWRCYACGSEGNFPRLFCSKACKASPVEIVNCFRICPPERSFIYSLHDRDHDAVMFVGHSTNLVNRMANHLKDPPKTLVLWIEELTRKNQVPILRVLQEVDERFAVRYQMGWVNYMKEKGFALLNT